MHDLADRLSNRVQLTTDGHRPYLEAVESAFGEDIDYARLVKIYGSDPETDKRYSPAKCLGCDVKTVTGNPNPKHVSTSYVERQNLTMRMSMRRFTRLTNAFSKKVEMHAHSVALHFMYYNFVKIHQSLRMTPAQAAGVTGRLWEVADLVELLEGSLMPDKGWIRKHDNDWESFVCEPEGESYRVSRRAHSLRGWSPWQDRGSIQLRYESGPFGWSASMVPSSRAKE